MTSNNRPNKRYSGRSGLVTVRAGHGQRQFSYVSLSFYSLGNSSRQ